MFAQFEADVFGKSRQEGRIGMHQEAKPVAGREETRIKEIYRTLVRRLHPDKQADGDTKVSAIWHEVQEAYETRNLNLLETLLALTEIQSGRSGGDASLWQIEGALAEIKRGLRAIQRSIREAKHDPSWGFSQSEKRVPVEKRVRREIEQSIAEQRWVLADLKHTLDDWSRPWHSPAKKSKKQPKTPEKSKTEHPQQKSNIPRPVQAELFGF
jgi:curved DNA-binding protein CbpA